MTPRQHPEVDRELWKGNYAFEPPPDAPPTPWKFIVAVVSLSAAFAIGLAICLPH